MLTVAAGKIMREQGSGRIVNITSPASRMALPNYTAYAASKAGVDSITRAAAVALAPYRRPRQQRRAGHDGHRRCSARPRPTSPASKGRSDLEAFLDERTRRIPLGRRADDRRRSPRASIWLALDAPDYVTAERLNASGGLDKD